MSEAGQIPDHWSLSVAIASRRILALTLGAALTACTVVGTTDAQASAAPVRPPTPNAQFDYQIGGAYDRPGALVVSRDRQAPADPDLYNICYINAFQSQPIDAEVADWRARGLTLKNARGEEVVDGDWNEILLDITTDAKRKAIAGTVNGWIDGCADAGFKAIEPDNIDAFSRSEGLTDVADTMAYLSLLISHAHGRGLAIAQKNAIGAAADGGIGTAGKNAGLDFAVVEECGRYNECEDYRSLYGNNMVVIEYTTAGYSRACTSVGAQVAVVRRNLAVSPSGPYQAC
jgi:hypothetical protein